MDSARWPQFKRLVRDILADGYMALRSTASPPPETLRDIAGMEVKEVTVAEGSPIAGKTLGEILLKKRSSVTVLAVRRNGALIPHPDGTCVIRPGDSVILTGTVEKIEGSLHLFAAPP